MSYHASISGHVESKKQEAEVLTAVAAVAEAVGAGGFYFTGQHFSVTSGVSLAVSVEAARALVEAYNAEADADDKTEG